MHPVSTDLPRDCYRFTHTIGVELWLTRADVMLMAKCAQHHYDGVCKGLVSVADGPGRKNGLLTIMLLFNLAEEAAAVVTLNLRELDTLLKTLEQAHPLSQLPPNAKHRVDPGAAFDVTRRLRMAFNAAGEEWARQRAARTNHIFPHLS